MAAEIAARLSAPRHVGGRSGWSVRRWRATFRASAWVEVGRSHAGQPAAGVAQAGGDSTGKAEVVGVEIDVERDERRPRADEHGAGGGVEPRRAVVRDDLPGGDPLGEPRGTAAA